MEYIIKYWETETDRNRGESNIYIPHNETDLTEVKTQATRLFNRESFAEKIRREEKEKR